VVAAVAGACLLLTRWRRLALTLLVGSVLVQAIVGLSPLSNVLLLTLTERFPAWQTGIRRDLDQVELELTGDTALLTARMTERSGDSGTAASQHVSRVSQIWVRRNGRWRVADVRIMGESRLNQIVR